MVDVQENSQSMHLSDRYARKNSVDASFSTCLSDRHAGKYSVETSFRLVCRKGLGKHDFKIDVQGNARYTHV